MSGPLARPEAQPPNPGSGPKGPQAERRLNTNPEMSNKPLGTTPLESHDSGETVDGKCANDGRDRAPALGEPALQDSPGGQREYSDVAIETALTLRSLFHPGRRQTEGFVGSPVRLIQSRCSDARAHRPPTSSVRLFNSLSI